MKSQVIDQAELAKLQASGKTLEQDERGIKVTLLPDGNILKVFRLRRLLSSGLIYSMAHRFCRNAKRLKKRCIATVEVIEVTQIKNCHLKTVKYVPLTGKTVREMLKTGEFNDTMAVALGRFIAELHQKGIYFRSLHCGNIVFTPNGEFGLIDIADLKMYPWSLWQSTVLRNFKHMYRYTEDIAETNSAHWRMFLTAYLNASHLSRTQQDFCEQQLHQSFGLNHLL